MPLPDLEPLTEPFGPGTRSCPTCHTGQYLHQRSGIVYCLKCMLGAAPSGQVIDCGLFPTLKEEYRAEFGHHYYKSDQETEARGEPVIFP